MKINRTFSIPVPIALKLKTSRNQSALVSRAISLYMSESETYSVSDLPTAQLMRVLVQRTDCPKHIRVLLNDALDNTYSID